MCISTDGDSLIWLKNKEKRKITELKMETLKKVFLLHFRRLEVRYCPRGYSDDDNYCCDSQQMAEDQGW